MDSDYDRKFQEMKKYIPFLEGMINKLESSNLPINPRQAHLDKIKSLRDLLENKKKRMKMENLLKCEQVLINLYAKVEQTDLKREGNKTGSKNTDLNTVRNKLKSIVTKLDQDDTSRSVTGDEVVDSAQTSLFERRSSKSCSTPVKEPLNDNKKNSPQASKRNYTRVLLSPERSDQKWSDDENPKTEKLYSRRSPRRISNKYSPTYKKERKKSKKLKDLQSKDLNITLNVPEESLSSLDTEDILSRIINCSDSDVDITTLRELRTQILGELKQTGVKDDISDLLLKSCKKNTAIEKKCEVEEGELSDSESETIENIYGSLVIVDKEKTTKDSVGKDKSRKIQICLVINSDKKGDNSLDHDKSNCVISGEASSFESYPVEKTQESDLKESKVSSEKVAVKKEEIQHHVKDEQPCRHLEYEGIVIKKDNKCDEIIKSQIEITKEEKETNDNRTEMSRDINDDKILEDNVISTNKNEQYFAPNFYKHDNDNKTITNTTSKSHKLDKSAVKIEDESNQTQETIQSPVEIPLLDLEASKKQEIVSEIDILQALKKEILGESPSSTTVENTPLLHQPKISKVSSAKEIVKKRISIENYKEKCHSSTEPRKPLFFREANKKRIQLTDKECERFNLPKKISFNDDDDNSIVSLGEIYSDLAPKSPDHEDFADTGIKPPVIIPSDPVEPTVVCSLLDVDMRHVSITPQILTGTTSASSISENTDKTKLSDPRKSRWESSSTKRENILPSFNPIDNPNQTLQSTLQTPCNSILNPNMAPLTPNRTPVFVPNARTYEVTPSRPSHDAEEIPTRKHVYAPSFSVANSFDTNDKNERFSMDNSSTPIWELNPIADVDNFDTNDSYGRLERSTTPVRSFDRFDCPSTPLPSFGRMECPTTPLPSFGRTERAMTPINSYSHFENSATTVHPFLRRGEGSATPVHSFGRSDGSTTPIHTFGHSDSSSTPSHIFGRSEGSITPVFSFNRSEDSPTPSYMYGRSDGSTTPAHAFGRSDSLGAPQSFDVSRSDSYRRSAKPPYRRHDPRLNRSYDHDNYNRPEDEKDYGYNRNPQFFSDYQSDQRFSESSSGCSQNYGRREFNRSRGRRGDWSYKDSYKSDREPSANRFIRKDRDSYRFRKKNSNYNERNLEKSIDKKHSADREREKAYTSLRKIDVSNVPSESRTLAIDTRVNTTFQGTNITLSSFDKRRQRAASVGRILTHEPSLGINKNTVTRRSETAESETRKRFLRASSVGREFHTNVSSSFKDVKADLRSFKLTNDYIVRKSTVDFKAENNSIKLNHAKGINERYSPRKNNRDPRMRRESRFDRAENSKVKTSPIGDTKKSGIVYTDSNISAGAITIGASSSVKNYKIPKIKRSPEKTVVSENVQEHEPSSTKLITKENSSSENNSKTNTESKEIVVYVTSKDTGEFQKEILKFQRNDNDINDSKEIELQKVKDLYKSVNENASSSYHRGAEKVDSSETLERRVTRSATNNTNVTDVSPSKSIRKYKRTIIYEDSDSDDKNDKSNNAMSQRKNTTVERGVEIKKVNIEDTSQQSSTMKNSNRLMPVVDVNLDVVLPQSEKNYKSEVNYEDIIANPDINNLTSSGCNVTTIDKSSEKVALKLENTAETTVAENNKDRNKTINNETNEITPSNTPYSTQKLDEKTSDYMAEHTNKESHINDNTEDPEPNKESDEFHSNFADLEIFSDTITTDPVLDNINALIADLDHDLDVEKNNESRGPFTQEITMENMLENITVNSMNSNDKINKPDENVSIEVNDISKNINSSASISSKNNENIYEQKTGEVKDSLINNDSNDATVSTTKEEVQSLKDKNNETREKNTTVDSLATPDSTINVENQSKLADENVPDSTNDFNDISSSNLISETQNKKSPNSHQSERAERSDSIGNFLSILQDKTKIKEVLSLLGDSSSEHAKIKRKLEKLSEIVSDDEENDNGSKDAVTNKNNKNKTECTLNKDSYNEVTEIQVNTVVENLDKKDKEEEAINDPKNVEFHETPHNLHSSKDSFQQAKEPEIGVEPLTSPKQLVEKEVKIQKRGRKQKTLNKGVASIKNAKKNTSVIPKTKKPSREVLNLQADIREMFLKDDKEILDGTTGLRMCRLAKLVDSKSQNDKSQNLQEDIIKTSSNDNSSDIGDKNIKKKTAKKSKSLNSTDRNASSEKVKIYEDSNSQSSTKSMYTNENESQKDPYVFETESVGESICTSEKKDDSSEYDSESSLGPDSCKSDLPERRTPEAKKKTKRKRSAWQSGVIVPKNKKKKNQISKIKTDSDPLPKLAFEAKLLDPNCYIDKLYCFSKNVLIYDCRLCSEKDSAIVHHYKTKHPHSEIPLSRMSPDVAQEAIKQCEKIDFQAIGAVPSQRYVCRFCFKEFASCKSFESFFWHVVSVHTGEYKYDCSICDTDKVCPFSLDIPPPPNKEKGHVTGYVCGNCNYTQISLENLKSHVISRHNDEKTEVYTINLSHMSTKSINTLLKRPKTSKEEQRVLRSSRSNISPDLVDYKEKENDMSNTAASSNLQDLNIENIKGQKKNQSKITFENDTDYDNITKLSMQIVDRFKVKEEKRDIEVKEAEVNSDNGTDLIPALDANEGPEEGVNESVKDINELPHFNVTFTETGSKQYVCCINQHHNHYKTSLMISFKKHVASHSEKWDGYCHVCKAIVMPQGAHLFKTCLQHFTDNHPDGFPVLESLEKQVIEQPARPSASPSPLEVHPNHFYLSGHWRN
ncbi:unnamed protein product [Leptosia nina]|uniref:C2H2-type domain-containing protein n=1 Tax=Leptosia nina TaxID=320188 RepID=A0AAV1J1E6_9NEOP